MVDKRGGLGLHLLAALQIVGGLFMLAFAAWPTSTTQPAVNIVTGGLSVVLGIISATVLQRMPWWCLDLSIALSTVLVGTLMFAQPTDQGQVFAAYGLLLVGALDGYLFTRWRLWRQIGLVVVVLGVVCLAHPYIQTPLIPAIIAAIIVMISLAFSRVVERERSFAARYRLMAENASDIVYMTTTESMIEWISPSVTDVLGWSPADLIGHSSSELYHPDDLPAVQAARQEVFSGTERQVSRLRARTAQGGHLYVSVVAKPLITDGTTVGLVVGVRDIDEVVRAWMSADAQRQRLRATWDSQIDPFMLLEAVRDRQSSIIDLRIVEANDAATRDLDRTRDNLVGLRILEALPRRWEDELVSRFMRTVDTGVPVILHNYTHVDSTSGQERTYDLRAFQTGDGLALTWQDVTDAAAIERELQRRAQEDDLTGLLNRSEGLARLSGLLNRRRQSDQLTVVLFCDLDHFKDINDSRGHAAGDQVLREVASRIRERIRQDDLAIRTGGDEFVVVLINVGSLTDARSVAESIRQAASEPITTSAGPVTASVSIGLAAAQPGESTDVLVARADGAMYRAKSQGRDRVILVE